MAVEASKTSLFPRVSEPGRSTSDLAISFVLFLGCFTQPRFHGFNIFRFVLEMLEGQVSSLGHPVVGHWLQELTMGSGSSASTCLTKEEATRDEERSSPEKPRKAAQASVVSQGLTEVLL